MSQFFRNLRNLVIGCLATIGALVVLVMFIASQFGDDSRPKRATTPTPRQVAPTETATVEPISSPTPLPLATTAIEQQPRTKTFIPSIQAAPTPNATGTAKAIEIVVKATAEVQATSEIATVEAVRANVTATAEQQRLDAIAITNQERINTPPEGSWCGNNYSRWVCVGDFRYETKISYDTASPNSRYIAFGVSVGAGPDYSISANPNDLTLVMADGRSYAYASETYSYWDTPLEHINIAPDDRAVGGIVFYVPNNVAPERIIYRGGLFESDIIISLLDPSEE